MLSGLVGFSQRQDRSFGFWISFKYELAPRAEEGVCLHSDYWPWPKTESRQDLHASLKQRRALFEEPSLRVVSMRILALPACTGSS